jgi:hypothetical protein
MSSTKKTLYEILNVASDASFSDIAAQHALLTRALEAQLSTPEAIDAHNNLKSVNMAFEVLRDTMSRNAYDAKLSHASAVAIAASPVGNQALPMKVEAISLKADAASLMAQAAMMNANALAMQNSATFPGYGRDSGGGFFKTFRFGFTVLGAFVAVGMVLMVVFLGRGSGGAHATSNDTRMQEKTILEDYYQTYGVRPASIAEMQLLEAQRRKEDTAKRDTDRVADKQERAEQRFIDDTKKLSEQVQENLKRDQELAQRQADQEEQRLRMEQDKIQREKEAKEEAERERIRRERRKLGLVD